MTYTLGIRGPYPFAIGALAMGMLTDATIMLQAGFWLTGAARALSGFWLILGMEETPPRINPAPEQEYTDA